MKCTKCGAAYKKSDQFCSNCGLKIKRENQFLKFICKNKTKIISVLILLILLVASFQIVSYLRSPEYIATKYLKDVINNNTEQIIKVIDLETNDFYNKETLKKKNDYTDSKNVELINKIVREDEALLTYRYKLNGMHYTTNVSLSKEDSLISNWKVNSGRISKDITLKFPKDATVKIDDIDIKKYLDEDSSTDDYDIYTISHMVTGEYKIEITLKDGTTVSDDITVSDNVNYSLGTVELDDTKKKNLTKITTDLMNTLYNGLINNVQVSELSYSDEIKDTYKDLKYNYKNTNYKLNSIAYTDLEITSTRYNDDSKLEVVFETEYNYNVSYESNDTASTYDGLNRGYVTVVFDYKDNYSIKEIKQLKNNFLIRK